MAKFPAEPEVGPNVPRIITGLPTGTKERPRADFKPGEFDRLIGTKGYRMWWSRRGICPCANNDQTEQPDPLCKLCRGDGYYSFMPDAAVKAGAREDGFGNEVTVSPDGKAVLIYVVMTAMTQNVEIFEKFGEWVFGTARGTTQPQNKLGYRDRLVSADSEMVWMQVIDYAGGDIGVVGKRSKAGLRFPLVTIDELRSVAKAFKLGTDFSLTEQGEIHWLPGKAPNAGTRLSMHGTIRPPWVVIEHVNSYRDTLITGGGTRLEGQRPVKLPVHAMLKLEFLVDQE